MATKGPGRTPGNVWRFLARPPMFVRSVYAETLLEDFFISAVASLLAIRLYLHVTGFPQLQIGPLHIAHLLWGGLFMLVALVIPLAFLDQRARIIAAVLGGIGFGAFIDELGKFITSDNDYFFQPAIAAIYVIFVLIFFAIRAISRRQYPLSQASLANVFDIAKQGSLDGLDPEEEDRALALLAGSPPGPIRDRLGLVLRSMRVASTSPARPLARFHSELDKLYRWAASRWWFTSGLIAFFALTAVTSISAVVVVVEWSLGLILLTSAGVLILAALVWSRQVKVRYLNLFVSASIIIVSILISWAVVSNLKGIPFSIVDWAQFIFPGISGVLIVMGLLTLPRSRLQAYVMFRRATLVSIFLIQVLAFYEQQLFAVLGLLRDILILLALRYMLSHEKGKRQFTV